MGGGGGGGVLRGWQGGARVSEFFFIKNPNLRKKNFIPNLKFLS